MIPANESALPLGNVVFAWSTRTGASAYTLEVATDPDFNNHIAGSPFPPVDEPLTTVPVNAGAQTYYWRVRADTTTGALPVSTFDGLDSVVRVYCAVGDDCVASAAILESGNLTHPFRSIRRGLASAAARGVSTVRVASRQGGAPYLENIIVPSGINLRGGWAAPSFLGPSADPTVLESATAATIAVGIVEASTFITDLTARTAGSGPALHVIGADHQLSINDCTFAGVTGANAPDVVRFQSTQSVQFSTNLVQSGPISIGIVISNSMASINASTIEVGPGPQQKTGVRVLFGGVPSVNFNEIRVSGTAGATGIDVFDGARLAAANNLVIVDGGAGPATGITISSNGSGYLEHNRVYAVSSAGNTSGFVASNALGTSLISNLFYASGGYAYAAQLMFSPYGVRLANNTMIVPDGNDAVYCNYTPTLAVNNIFATLGPSAPGAAWREGIDSRPWYFTHNLLMSAEKGYVVSGVDTDPDSLDDPTGAAGTWARFSDNIVELALDPVQVFADLTGPGAPWDDFDFSLRADTDPLGIATAALDLHEYLASYCVSHAGGTEYCPYVFRDAANELRTDPMSLGAYEKAP